MNTVYSEILSHGTCGFMFRLGSGSAHRSVDPLQRVSAGEGAKAGLSSPAWVSVIAAEISALHFLMTWRAGKLIFMGGLRSSFSSI